MDEATKKMQSQLYVITDTLVGNVKKDLLNVYAKYDQSLREKIEFHFDSFKGDAVSKEDITARMESAFTLATGNKPTQSSLDNISGSGDKGDGAGAGDTKEHVATENEKNIGKVWGISEEDRQKYGLGGEKAPNTNTKDE